MNEFIIIGIFLIILLFGLISCLLLVASLVSFIIALTSMDGTGNYKETIKRVFYLLLFIFATAVSGAITVNLVQYHKLITII